MELILVVVGIVLIIAVLGLLVWLIISNFAGRKEITGGLAGNVSSVGKVGAHEPNQKGQDKCNQNDDYDR